MALSGSILPRASMLAKPLSSPSILLSPASWSCLRHPHHQTVSRQYSIVAPHRIQSSAFRPSRTTTATLSSSLALPPFQVARPSFGVDSSSTLRCVSPQQRRGFLGFGNTHKFLAQMEKTAKLNSNSASAQNAFYSALLKANMPAIVVERYRSGRYASNKTTDAVYATALEHLGLSTSSANAISAGGAVAASSPARSSHTATERAGAAAQTIANKDGVSGAEAEEKSVGMTGSGSPEDPLVVQVSERWHTIAFRWVKFVLVFGATIYFLLMIITLFVETTGMLKNVGAGQTKNAEAVPEKQTVRFSDVHGCDNAKEELQELVDFLANPEMFTRLGGKLPKGVLLVGPPGTGKTLLARAVAGEAGVPYFYMSGSEFDEMYVGVGAKRVRELFNQARAKAPAIIFIDELDAIGAKRNEKDQVYVKQTLNQLLTELDGFSKTEGVIIIGATNYPQLLDKALVRPGRFDRRVVVGLPDVRGRIEILNHHMKNVQISTNVDSSIIARGTIGFSGAELENLVNQAAIHASRNKKTKVEAIDFDWAKDKIIMGAENKQFIQDKDKKLTAYHEAGHALVAYYSPAATPLYKITIAPRGRSLGATHFLPKMDLVSRNMTEYLSDIDVSLGGKVAEEIIFGNENVTSGISQDLKNATDTAWTLVTQLGYSPTLGSVDLASNYNRLSSETKQQIEGEVRRLVEEGRDRATKILSAHKHELEVVTKALLEYETLTKDEMDRVLKGEKLERLGSSDSPTKSNDGGNGNGKSNGGKKKRDDDEGKNHPVGVKLPDLLKDVKPGSVGGGMFPRPPPPTTAGKENERERGA